MIELVGLSVWQERMLHELFSEFDTGLFRTLTGDVCVIQVSAKERDGNGHYHKDNKLVTVGYAPHPRYFVEVVFHELGHGLDEQLSRLGLSPFQDTTKKQTLYPFGIESAIDPHSLIDFPALATFNPKTVEGLGKQDPIYRKMISAMDALGRFRPIELDRLVERYVRIAEQELERNSTLSPYFKEIFRSQATGYLRQRWRL